MELPPDWSGSLGGNCATLRANPPLGVLQISAARKEAGIITDEDLVQFAEDRIAPETPLNSVECGAFSGATARYRKDGLFWQEWWLKSNRLMVYVTYNVVQEHEGAEGDVIQSILATMSGLGW